MGDSDLSDLSESDVSRSGSDSESDSGAKLLTYCW